MKLFSSTLLVGGNTLVSRVLGFVRDMVLAWTFGAGAATDAFFVAFRIPNFLRRLFAEGSFAPAFVPVFQEYRERRGREELRALVDRVAGTLAAVLLAVTGVGILAAPAVVAVFAPGFLDEPATFELAAGMLRITFPYLLCISLVALAGGILNSLGRFAIPAFTPVLLNVSLIAAALWLAPYMQEPVSALAWGVLAAGVVQLLFQVWPLRRAGLLPRPRWGWSDSGVRRILRLMLPTLFSSSVYQVNMLINTLIASLLASGSITWLYYSDRLLEFPVGVFAIALSTVILPNLSGHFARGDSEAYSRTLDWALRLAAVIALPAAVGLGMLAAPILAALFQYRAFTGQDVHMASLSLAAFALGLPAFVGVKILAPGFYSRQDTKTPVKVAVASMVSNIVFSALIVFPLWWHDVRGAHAGLALASSLAVYLNSTGLLWFLVRRGHYRPSAGWSALLGRVLAASLLMGGALQWLSTNVGPLGAMPVPARVGWLALMIFAGVAVYGTSLFGFGFRFRHLRHPS